MLSKSNDSSENSIVGAWTLTEVNVANSIDINEDGIADRNFMNEVPCFEGTVAFTDSGAFSQTFSDIDVTIYDCIGTIATTGTYELNGNQLSTVTLGPEPTTATTTIKLFL